MSAIVRYFAIVFALTWACWLVAGGYADSFVPHAPNSALKFVLIELGVFMPGIVAIIATAFGTGWCSLGKLLLRLVRWRVSWQWYAFAILFMPATKLSAATVYRIAYGHWPAFGHEQFLLMLAATVVSVLFLGQVGEELGWRGYALPRLSASMGLGGASLVVGFVWACWHLPLFFLFSQADTYGQSFPVYLAQVTALSVAISWLWWRSSGSLLLTMLFHAAANNLKDIVPSTSSATRNVFSVSAGTISWLFVGILWLAALVFLFQMFAKAGRFIPADKSQR